MNRILKRAFYSSLFLILSGCGSVSDQQQVEKAKEYLAKGDQKSALIELKSALQQNPQNSSARTYLGQLYLKAGNYAAAEKELKNARELGADDNDTLSSLGQALLQLRKLDEVRQKSQRIGRQKSIRSSDWKRRRDSKSASNSL